MTTTPPVRYANCAASWPGRWIGSITSSPNFTTSPDVQIAVVEAARRVRVRQHREPARTQLGDAGDVILVGVREQHGVQLEPLRARMGDERLQVAVAVDQNGIGAGADEVRARVPAVVARRHDRDGRRAGSTELGDGVDEARDLRGHVAIVIGARRP